MDSLEFLRWLAVYFHDDLLTLRVALFLMGSQEPGGLIRATQKEIATALSAHRVHVNRSVGVLYRLGVVHMVQRGMYQLNPQASLRGGVVEVEEAEPRAFSTGAKVKRKIDQLVLIDSLDLDPKVLDEFKNLKLPAPHPRKRKRKNEPVCDEAAEG
ncbi:helix-turn-helix domain-containing protein [Streptomyces spororaveus]|nr:helix-turn-helix domain-containing protein [Streptomyces spororaveus]